MGTTPDGKHIRGEKLFMKGKPAKQLTLGFSVGSPEPQTFMASNLAGPPKN
jgi:hypothetical protein